MSTEPSKPAARYYWTRGTMPPMNRSYIERHADQELFEAIKAGDFCYVLTSRQMGKSSLVSRAAGSLRGEGYRFGFIDLSGLGKNLTAAQWFDGMMVCLGDDFDIEDEIKAFRKANTNLGPQQMWLEVIRRVLLREVAGRVVIVIDEIDYVRSIENFSTDELFTGIRELFNRRSREPELERLSFCLMGVASPADLIENKDITPFNIGHRIELRDFTAAESLALADGLTRLPHDKAQAIVSRVFHWSGGQPYLTQKICTMAAADESVSEPAHVDLIVSENFLSQRARETDDNLTAIRDRIDKERTLLPEFTKKLLGIYSRVLNGRRVEDSEVLPEVAALKLTGLVRGEKGRLVVKNPIYRENFNARWVAERMPKDWARMAALWGRAAVILLVIVCPVVAVWALKQRSKADLALRQTVLEKEALDKSRAEAFIATERARQEAAAATRQALLATEEKKKANADILVAKAEQEKAAAAMGQLYKAQTTNFWSDGRRIVEAMFFRRAMEAMVKLPEAAKEEMKKAAAKLLADDASKSADLVIQGMFDDAPKSDDPKTQTPPLANGAGRELTSHVEPAGAFKLPLERPVTDIIPWWHQPGFLVLQKDKKDDSLRRMFAWDLSPMSNQAVQDRQSLNFPFEVGGSSLNEKATKFARTLAASKDGRRLLVLSTSGNLHVWELQPQVSSLAVKTERKLAAAAFLPDGKKIIAAVIDGPVVAIELATGIESEPILPPSGEWTALALSPTADRCVVGRADGTVMVAGTGPAKVLPVQWRQEGRVSALAFLPDGKTCVVATTTGFDGAVESGTVELRDAAVGKTASASYALQEGVESLAISPDGSRIAVGTRLGKVCLIDSSTFKETARLLVLNKSNYKAVDWSSRINVCFSVDGGRLVASTCYGEIGVWSADGRDVVTKTAKLSVARGPVVALPDGRIANAGLVSNMEKPGNVALFEVNPVAGELRYLTIDPESSEVSGDGPIPELTSKGFTAAAFCSSKGVVALSVVNTPYYSRVSSFSHVAVGYAKKFKELKEWVSDAERENPRSPGRELRLTFASFTAPKAQANKAAASMSKRSSGEASGQASLEDDDKNISEAPCCLALSNDGKRLAAGFLNGDVAVLDITLPDPQKWNSSPESNLRWRKSCSKSAIKTLSFASYGLVLMAGDDKKITNYKAASGELDSEGGYSGPVVMGPDDLTHLVTKDSGNDGALLRMQHGAHSADIVRAFRSSFPPVAFAFSPEGSWHAAGLKNGSISLGRDDGAIETIPAFSEKPAQPEALAFSPDGRCLVAADQHGWLRMWRFFPKAVPIFREGESLEDAKSRWSVDVSDALTVVGVLRENKSWRDLRASQDDSRDIVESWRIIGQVSEWYRDSPVSIPRKDIDALLAEAEGARGKLEKCGQDCRHMQPLEKLKELFAWKPGTTEANEKALVEIEKLAPPLRWLLLSSCLKSVEWPKPQARELWLNYARLQQERLSFHSGGDFKRETLDKPWQAVFDEGVLAVNTSVEKGARYVRKADSFYNSPQLAAVKAKLTKWEEQYTHLSAVFAKITETQNETIKREQRSAYINAYDEAIKSGYEPHVTDVSRAHVQARLNLEYERAAAYLDVTASMDDSADTKVFVELCGSYQADELGRLTEALEHIRKATAIPLRQQETWERRFELEFKAAGVSGDQTDLKRCIADLEKAAGDKKYEEPWRLIFLKEANFLNKFGKAKETRAFAEEVFKKHPTDINLYNKFWVFLDVSNFPDEEYRLWALTVLNQGIKAGSKKVAEENSKTDKSDLFMLYYRRAAHDRQQGEFLKAVVGYNETFEHALDDFNRGWVLTDLGDCLRRLGLYADAEKCFDVGLPNDKSTWALDVYAILLGETGRIAEALPIDKGLFESKVPDINKIVGLSHATAYALSLRRAGNLMEAKAVLRGAVAPDTVVSQSTRASCLKNLAFLLKREIVSSSTASAQIPALEAEMKKVIAEVEAVNARLPEEDRTSIVWLPWLQGDLDGTVRKIEERAAKDKKPNSSTPFDKAAVAALKEDTEEALTQLAVSLSFHWYLNRFSFDSLEYHALAKLPAVKELMATMPVKNISDLPQREERIAAWMDALPITKPENRKLVADAAKACRKRAAEMRKAPLTLPDFTKDESKDKSTR